ncbi:hypothetical protein N0V90_010944 [Kalmusia sp. IMI 367209]|nr:hypothetical protein N0V90_010944 [Kalmusia sp. IMI 367209]
MSSAPLPSSRTFITRLFDALHAALPAAHDDDGVVPLRSSVNPLQGAPEAIKRQLLALHVVFPNELLPALDLLDRTLVTRFRIRRSKEGETEGAAPQQVRRCQGDGALAPGTSIQDGRPGLDSAPNPSPSSSGIGTLSSSDAYIRAAPDAEVPGNAVSAILRDAANGAMDVIYYVRSAQQRSSRYGSSVDSTTSYEVRLKAWNCSCPAFAFSAFPPVHPEPPVPMYDPTENVQTTEGEWTFGGVGMGSGVPPVCKHLLACVLAERCAGLFGSFVEEKTISVEEAAGWAAGWGD